MRTMPPYYLVVCLLLLAAMSVPASDVRAQEDAAHSLRAGAWALQFSINQDFVLGSFLGSSVSAKKHVSDSRAWQFGLTVDALVQNHDSGDTEMDSDRQHLGVSAHHLWYPQSTGRADETIHWFFGVGPRLFFTRSSESAERPGGDEEATSTLWGAGISGVIGAEWFVHDQISLFAAYGTAFEYSGRSSERESPGQEADDTTENALALRSEGVRFGVSIYL